MRAAMLALAILLTAQGCPAEEPQKPRPTQRCAEDDPCFDCHEDGNKKCGPGAGVVLAVKHSTASTDNQ